MDEPIARIEAKLKKYPDARYELIQRGIRIAPPNARGFAITLTEEPPEWVVSFGQVSHSHFGDVEDALSYLAFGLSDRCRVREMTRGSMVQRAIVEARDGDTWKFMNTTGLLFFPFWRRKQEIVYQNNLVRDDHPN